MIEILNVHTRKKEYFLSYGDLVKHIEIIEEDNFLGKGKEIWSLSFYSHRTLELFYWQMVRAINVLLTEEQQRAYEKKLSLLEICKGHRDEAVQIILTPDVDVEEIKKDWCKDYCLSHGYLLKEKEPKVYH